MCVNKTGPTVSCVVSKMDHDSEDNRISAYAISKQQVQGACACTHMHIHAPAVHLCSLPMNECVAYN